MKKSLYLMIPAILAVAGCGSTAALSSGQKFNDGIYYARQEKTPAVTGTDDLKVNDLVDRTKKSEIYLFGDEKADTVVIPENKSAVINFNNSSISSITITDDPFEQTWYSNYALLPAAAWTFAWSTLWWDPWYWDPWYYGVSWYRNPWYSGIWWDPWYWNPWYRDPWYHRPYWGYDPYWHHHHWHHHHTVIWDHHYYPHRDVYYGSRNSTGSFGSRSSTVSRSRSASGSAVSRNVSGVSRSSTVSRSSVSGLRSVSRSSGTVSRSSGTVSRSSGVPFQD